MDPSIGKVLDDELLSDRRRFLSEYQFAVGKIPRRVTIRLYEDLETGKVEFEQSHYIKTELLHNRVNKK